MFSFLYLLRTLVFKTFYSHYLASDFISIILSFFYLLQHSKNVGIIIKIAAAKLIYANTRVICIKTRAQTPRKTFSVLRSLKNKNKILKIIKEATAIIIDQTQIPANKLLNLHKISLSIIIISHPYNFFIQYFRRRNQ